MHTALEIPVGVWATYQGPQHLKHITSQLGVGPHEFLLHVVVLGGLVLYRSCVEMCS